MNKITDQYGEEHTVPGPFDTIEAIEAANVAADQYWFSPQSLKFFDSKIEKKVYAGRIFLSSEQFHGSHGSEPRRWTIRIASDEGEIYTALGFQEFASKALAEAAVLDLLETAGANP